MLCRSTCDLGPTAVKKKKTTTTSVFLAPIAIVRLQELYADLARSARRRLHHLLGSGPAPFFQEPLERWPLPGGAVAQASDAFGLGRARSLGDYEAAAGLSFAARRLDPRALRGGAPREERAAAGPRWGGCWERVRLHTHTYTRAAVGRACALGIVRQHACAELRAFGRCGAPNC